MRRLLNVVASGRVDLGLLVTHTYKLENIVAAYDLFSHQRDGVQQVGQAVAQMDEATQQNAALVEVSAASAESLIEQAQQLVHAISVFRLGDDNTRSYAAPQLSAWSDLCLADELGCKRGATHEGLFAGVVSVFDLYAL